MAKNHYILIILPFIAFWFYSYTGSSVVNLNGKEQRDLDSAKTDKIQKKLGNQPGKTLSRKELNTQGLPQPPLHILNASGFACLPDREAMTRRGKKVQGIWSINPPLAFNTALAFAASRNEPPQKLTKQMAQRRRFGPFALQQKDLTWLVKKPERLEDKALPDMVFDLAQAKALSSKKPNTQGLQKPPFHTATASGFACLPDRQAMTEEKKRKAFAINPPLTFNLRHVKIFGLHRQNPSRTFQRKCSSRRIYSCSLFPFKAFMLSFLKLVPFGRQPAQACLTAFKNQTINRKKELGLAGYEAGKVVGKAKQYMVLESAQTNITLNKKLNGSPQPPLYSFKTSGFIMTKEDDNQKRLMLRKIYLAEIGVREKTNNNDGPAVENYLRYTKNKKGDPWCAAFVCWALAKAGIENPRSAWSPDLFPTKRVIWKNSWQVQEAIPQTGDIFGIWFANKKRIAHVGFLDQWGDSQVITVEGNTNESGSREGDGVYRKRRHLRTIYAFANWIDQKGAYQ